MKEIGIPFIALVVGLLIGSMVGNPPVSTKDEGHDHDVDSHIGHEEHTHDGLEVESHDNLPEVELVMHADAKSGWNAQIITKNFSFSPENASKAHVEGEGHAHIYVDGVKINRVYGEWYHLGDLEPGTHEVEVSLTTNDHRALLHDGVEIADTKTVVVE